MEILIIVLLVVLIALIGVGIFLLRKPSKPAEDNGVFSLLMQQMNDLRSSVDDKLGKVDDRLGRSNEVMTNSLTKQFSESQRQISEANKLIKDVTKELVEVKEGNKQVQSVTEQLRALQDILKNPKQRGVLGEYYLETLLQNTMPGGYKMQYKFLDGEIVDAIVMVQDKIIPVDSKFSLENYNRYVEENNVDSKERLRKLFVNDLKMRIKETSKYIRAAENTLDFAFMFIPHEAIYYDLLTNRIGAGDDDSQNLLQTAASKYKVIIVSPTSFLAYLQTVLLGLNRMKIEERANEIVIKVGELSKHLKAYEDYQEKLGNSLGTTVNHFNSSLKEFKKIDKDVVKITGTISEFEVLAIDKPDLE